MKIILVIVISLLLSIIVITPSMAATARQQFESGVVDTAQEIGYTHNVTLGNLSEIIAKVIRVLLSFLGVFFLVLIIYGGYIWMLARGNEQEVTRAKNIMQNAIIGLIIVLAAYAVTWGISQYLIKETVKTQ